MQCTFHTTCNACIFPSHNNGDPSKAKATFKEVLAYFHKFPINWTFYFDGACEGKAALGARREQKRLACYQK